MRETQVVTGYCPVLDDEYSVTVFYVQVFQQYQKDIYRCEYAIKTGRNCGFNCPVYRDAPNFI